MSRRIWTGVSFGWRRGRWSVKVHLCAVLHRYGPCKEFRWVRALCGAGAGRAGLAWTNERCRRCEAAEARRLRR